MFAQNLPPMAHAPAAIPPTGILLRGIQSADIVQNVMFRDASEFRYISDLERGFDNVHSEEELRAAHRVIQMMALLGSMDEFAAQPPEALSNLIVVILDAQWADHGNVTDDFEEAGFGFADSLAVYQLKPSMLPNGHPLWDLNLVANLLHPAAPDGPRPAAPPRLRLSLAQLERVRAVHENFRLALPAIVYPDDARFVDIDTEWRPVLADIIRPVEFQRPLQAQLAPAFRDHGHAPPALHAQAAPGVSQEMILRAQSKDFVQNSEKVLRLQGIMSVTTFHLYVGNMAQDIPVWANVLAALRILVSQTLGPRQVLSEQNATQFLALKFGSLASKPLPTHMSWTFFGTDPVIDVLTLLAAADRLLSLIAAWFGMRPATALRLLVEQLRQAMTPDPNRCNDTLLGLADTIDIINHALHLIYNDTMAAPPEPAEVRWERIIASIPLGPYWSALSLNHQRAELLRTVQVESRKRPVADAAPGSDRAPKLTAKRCRFQDDTAGCPFGLLCRGVHDVNKPKQAKETTAAPKTAPKAAAAKAKK
jgi:hypothetical protein